MRKDCFCLYSAEEQTLIATFFATQLTTGKSTSEVLFLKNMAAQISASINTIYLQRLYADINCKKDIVEKPDIVK